MSPNTRPLSPRSIHTAGEGMNGEPHSPSLALRERVLSAARRVRVTEDPRRPGAGRLQAGDELADQLRPAEDPGGRRQEDGAGQSVDEMPRLRADAGLFGGRSPSPCRAQ